MEKLKVLELFAGLGACSKALERLNIPHEIVDAVEIDKYAIQSFNAIHGTNFEPQDITTWDKDIKVDLIMHGSPCVTADSLILTKDGYKSIIDVQVGDEVLTKSNVWHKVAKKFNNGLHQTCYLDGMGFENIHCTLNHKFYVREMYRKGHKNIRCFKEPVFKEAKDLTKKDYFGVPVIQEEKTFYTDECDFWYMLGMYLGDGWLSKTTNDTIIACNDIKLKKLKSHLDKEKWKYTYYKEKTCYKFRFSNKNVYQFIKKYIGTGSDNKHIPYEILCLPKKQLQSFYDGYLDSDGCVVENYHQFSSINRGMLYSVSLIINKLYNRPTCFYKIKVAKTKIIEGREVNQKEWYQLRFKPTTNKQDKAFYEDGYIWYPFNKLTIAKKENVYNMEVEEDHSYIIQGCISKNCQDFSLAGKQAGGDKDSGTRSSLMYETIRIVEKLKPNYVVWENVKNLLSKKHRHNFDAYLETLKQLGYKNYYQVLNAKDYGIPQSRERVFTISIRNDIDKDFHFPEKQPLELRLKDMLDNEVDEKYYLSDKMVNYILDNNDTQKGTKWEGRADNDTLNSNIAHTLSVRGAGGCQRAGVSNFIIDNYEQEIKVKDIKIQTNKTTCLNSKGGRNGVEGLQPSLKDRIYDSNGISTCVATSNFFMPNYTDGLRIRKLTPREVWRLMGFDDEDFEKAEKINSNTQLYKQAGNSIVVNVLEAIFKELFREHIKDLDKWSDLD